MKPRRRDYFPIIAHATAFGVVVGLFLVGGMRHFGYFHYLLYTAIVTGLYTWRMRGVSKLAKELGNPKPEKRNQAFDMLIYRGEPSVTQFVEVLTAPSGKSKNWHGKEAKLLAVDGIGKLRSPKGMEALLAVLNDADHELRSRACIALGDLGDPRSVPALIPLLGDDRTTACASASLSRLGRPELVQAFDDSKHLTAGIEFMRNSPHRREFVRALILALDSVYVPKNIAAAGALGELGAVEALPALRRETSRLRSEYEEVRAAARAAIEKLEALAQLPRAADSREIDSSTLPRATVEMSVDASTLPKTITGASTQPHAEQR